MLSTKKTLVGVGAAALLATGGTMTATAAQPSADAKPTAEAKGSVSTQAKWKSCPKGALCLYTKKKGQGKVYKVWATSGKNYKNISSMYNNGKTSEAMDHVKVTRSKGGTVCLNPKGWRSGLNYTVTSVKWVKSC